MLIADCIPCQYGHHDDCMGTYQQPPEGMIGGARCGCKGDCAERYAKRSGATGVRPAEQKAWTCSYCLGNGCEECDGKGNRYRQTWNAGDATISVSGSGTFDPKLQEAFEALAAAAFAQMDAEDAPSSSTGGDK